MALVAVKVPDIGDLKDVEIIELLVKPGDMVEAEQSLLTVESDKASMEIPSSQAGVVKELKVKLGDRVNEGTPVLLLETEGSEMATAVTPPPDTSALVPVVNSAPVEVLVPDIGDFDEVAVIEVFVKPGDTIQVEQSLITLESDKASMEIPSSLAGAVTEVCVKVGDRVRKGSVIAFVAVVNGADVSMPSTRTAPATSTSTNAIASAAQAASSERILRTSPSVRKLARELKVPLDEVKGTGPRGRIFKEDVLSFAKGPTAHVEPDTQETATSPRPGDDALFGLLPWPRIDFAKFGPIDTQPLSRIRKLSGANLARNWVMIPHVTNHDEADITELDDFRIQLNTENEKSGIRITMLAFLIKAVVSALKKFPDFNASLDGDQLVLKRYYHVGFAADTPNGLVVPVIKDADKKGLLEIAKETAELAKKARDGKLGASHMQGACFTISSLGGIGGTSFTPIINAPEVAILGISKTQTKPVWDGEQFAPRQMLPLSLSYDHRVIDGAAAARFNAHLGQLLADFRRVLL